MDPLHELPMNPMNTHRYLRQTIALSSIAAFTMLGVTGCGSSSEPAHPTAPTAPTTSATPIPPPPTADAGIDSGSVVVRTIETRNPFGNVGIVDNLVADGDFEFTGRGAQPGWWFFDATGQPVTITYETGGRCRSGVRCASVPAGQIAFGLAVSPKTGTMNASLWLKPASGHCTDADVGLLDFETGTTNIGTALKSTSKDADSTGWCKFTGTVPNLANTGPAIAVEVKKTGGAVVIDDVVLTAVEPQKLVANARVALSPSLESRVRAAGAWIRTHRIYGRNPRQIGGNDGDFGARSTR